MEKKRVRAACPADFPLYGIALLLTFCVWQLGRIAAALELIAKAMWHH